ncbi:MAG: hypothetical protein JO251_12740 [Verrucomicrobia bacterium]|nr:hypothetical protein [Verrucomicrobiota bacterium]MBV8640313.1 hypothetical protein [Verrucomicrobiota bacterium]
MTISSKTVAGKRNSQQPGETDATIILLGIGQRITWNRRNLTDTLPLWTQVEEF